MKRLYRTEGADAKFLGVCGGIAEFFNIDPTIVRIGFVFFAFAVGSGLLAYLICALVMPKKSTIM